MTRYNPIIGRNGDGRPMGCMEMDPGGDYIALPQLEELVRAVWNAAYLTGFDLGQSNAMAIEVGESSEVTAPEDAWGDTIGWRIKSDLQRFNIANEEHWKAIKP